MMDLSRNNNRFANSKDARHLIKQITLLNYCKTVKTARLSLAVRLSIAHINCDILYMYSTTTELAIGPKAYKLSVLILP